MAIPPVNDDDAQNRRYLAQVYKLFVQAGERGYQNVAMETLSMGMSGDFENAIRRVPRWCASAPPFTASGITARRDKETFPLREAYYGRYHAKTEDQ